MLSMLRSAASSGVCRVLVRRVARRPRVRPRRPCRRAPRRPSRRARRDGAPRRRSRAPRPRSGASARRLELLREPFEDDRRRVLVDHAAAPRGDRGLAQVRQVRAPPGGCAPRRRADRARASCEHLHGEREAAALHARRNRRAPRRARDADLLARVRGEVRAAVPAMRQRARPGSSRGARRSTSAPRRRRPSSRRGSCPRSGTRRRRPARTRASAAAASLVAPPWQPDFERRASEVPSASSASFASSRRPRELQPPRKDDGEGHLGGRTQSLGMNVGTHRESPPRRSLAADAMGVARRVVATIRMMLSKLYRLSIQSSRDRAYFRGTSLIWAAICS